MIVLRKFINFVKLLLSWAPEMDHPLVLYSLFNPPPEDAGGADGSIGLPNPQSLSEGVAPYICVGDVCDAVCDAVCDRLGRGSAACGGFGGRLCEGRLFE
jgi:hypothetical protein